MARHGTIRDYSEAIRQMISDGEFTESGGEIRTYFDSADVVNALLGMEAFYDGAATFQRSEFESDRTLVQCLAGAGWLGTISMLMPHQAEFLALLRIEFGRHPTHAGDMAAKFWKDAGVLELGESLQSLSLRDMSTERIAQIISHQIGSAATFFKAVHSIAGTWQQRLRNWTSQRILTFDRAADDLENVVASADFFAFRRAFDTRREGKPLNNFADAAALTILAAKIADVREGRSRIFPVFYAAHRLIRDVAEAARTEAFTIVLPSGRAMSALRAAPYFIMKGIQQGAPREQPFYDPEELRGLESDLDMLSARDRPDVLGLDEKVRALLTALTDLGFFDRVWLPYAAANDTAAALTLLNESELQTAIAAEIHHVQAELQASAAAYRTLFRLNEELRAAYARLRNERAVALDADSDAVAILGLTPFALTPSARRRASELVRGLLNDDQAELNAVMRLYLQAQRGDERASEAAEIVCAILWPAGIDDLILSLRRRDRIPPLAVDLITAAAAIRSGRDLAEAQASIVRLERRYEQAATRNRGEIAIGLARLYGALGSRTRTEARVDLWRKAVEYALAATELTDDDAPRAYAYNQLLYYLVQTENADADVLRHTAERLLDFRQTHGWQYRFDDTLALYFASRANAAADTSQRLELLKMAAAASKRAMDVAPSDPEIVNTDELIRYRLAEERT